jgi:sugar/nucleoside kinase (ribokinase family)
VRGAGPDLLFAAGSEAGALADDEASLLDVAPIVVLKRGPQGASLVYRDGGSTSRFEVAAKPVEAADTTGAGDAFDAGFILGWLAAKRSGASLAAALRRGASHGNRLAVRHLLRPPKELAFD